MTFRGDCPLERQSWTDARTRLREREEKRGRKKERETDETDTHPKVVGEVHSHVETAIRPLYYLARSRVRISAHRRKLHRLDDDAEERACGNETHGTLQHFTAARGHTIDGPRCVVQLGAVSTDRSTTVAAAAAAVAAA